VSSSSSSSDGMFAHDRAAAAAAPRGATETAATLDESFLEREGEPRLYLCELAPERGQTRSVLALLHGYGEHCRRYDELAFYLAGRGHAVCRMDARGHGRSAGQRGHIRRFDDYVDDFAAFIARVAARYPKLPLFVLGHSNGGLIALRALQRGLPGVRGVVLTSPLLGLRPRHRPVPDAVARALSWALPRLPLPSGLGAAELTHDPELRAAHARDPWIHRVATPRWYWSTTLAGREALAAAPRLVTPLLVVQGQVDPIVEPALAQQLCERAGSADKLCWVRPGELHEVLNEIGRLELFASLAQWIEQRAS
jgi:alpha-beta hydrolase superfamily lysophospholipase